MVCFFVVWTENDLSYERIKPDYTLLHEAITQAKFCFLEVIHDHQFLN